MNYAALYWASTYWAWLHPIELHCTTSELRYALWAALQSTELAPTELGCPYLAALHHFWAAWHPFELRCNILSFAVPYWAMLHPRLSHYAPYWAALPPLSTFSMLILSICWQPFHLYHLIKKCIINWVLLSVFMLKNISETFTLPYTVNKILFIVYSFIIFFICGQLWKFFDRNITFNG